MVWLTWDANHLYLSAKIKDDTFHQPESGGNIWLGDSIQFAVSPGLPGQHAGMNEFGMALTSSGPQLYRWSGIGSTSGTVTNRQLSITRNAISNETVYELALPWTELSPITTADQTFSLSLLANDNDGSGRKGWIEWGGGIGGSKNTALFHPVTLQ
jgi:hypothetical protein